MNLDVTTEVVRDIPTLTIAPRHAEACPVVFFVPGFGGAKEAGLHLGYRLARQGMVFVSFDPIYHGERRDARLDDAANPELGGIYPAATGMDTTYAMFQVIGACASDIGTLIDHLASHPGADVRRCGVTGLSMGGYASFLAFADEPRMRAAVPMIGIPRFAQRWRDLLDECAYSNPEWAAALQSVDDLTRERTRYVESLDPYPRLGAAAPRALLMMSCDFDTDQPKLYSVHAYRELQQDYRAAPHNLRLRIYPAGHEVTPAMQRDAVEWMTTHLLPELA